MTQWEVKRVVYGENQIPAGWEPFAVVLVKHSYDVWLRRTKPETATERAASWAEAERDS